MIFRPARARRLAGPVALLATILPVLLHAVAFAVPPEPLHLPGLQDGGDYDSLIQPLVLALFGVPATERLSVARIGLSRDLPGAFPPAPRLNTPAPIPPPRAPTLA